MSPPTAGLASLALLVAIEAVGRFSLAGLGGIVLLVVAFGPGERSHPVRFLLRAGLASLAVFLLAGWARAGTAATGEVLSLSPSARIVGGLVWAIVAGTLVVLLDRQGPKAWMVRARARLTALLPHPDPDFDPFATARSATPPVREMVLYAGPTPGSGRRPVFGEPIELGWG